MNWLNWSQMQNTEEVSRMFGRKTRRGDVVTDGKRKGTDTGPAGDPRQGKRVIQWWGTKPGNPEVVDEADLEQVPYRKWKLRL